MFDLKKNIYLLIYTFLLKHILFFFFWGGGSHRQVYDL